MSFTRFTFSTAAAALVLLAVACAVEGPAAPAAISGSADTAASRTVETSTPSGTDFESTATPAPAPPAQSTPTPELPTVVPATSTPAAPAATVTTEGCYDRGYAGIVHRVNGVTTYGLVEPPDDPNDAARAVAETWCVLNGRFTPPGEVRVIKVDYTLKQLKAWYSLLRDQVWQIEGLWSGSVDEGNNRLSYGVLSELGKSRVFELAQELGIPVEAVFAEIPPQIGLNNPQAIPSEGGMEISVEYSQEITSGQPTEFSVIVTNSNDQEKEIMYNSAYPADIVILDPSGPEIWRYKTGVIIQPGGLSLLLPGESISFPVSWSGLSHDGIAVPPGQYLVRGFVKFSFEGASSEGRYVGHDLSTTPEEILIAGK